MSRCFFSAIGLWLLLFPLVSAENIETGPVEVDYQSHRVPHCAAEVAPKICVAYWGPGEDESIGDDEVGAEQNVRKVKVTLGAPGAPERKVVVDPNETVVQHPLNVMLNDTWVGVNDSLPPEARSLVWLESKRGTGPANGSHLFFVTVRFPMTVGHPMAEDFDSDHRAVDVYSWDCGYLLGPDRWARTCSRDELRPLAGTYFTDPNADEVYDAAVDATACDTFSQNEQIPPSCVVFDPAHGTASETVQAWKDSTPNVKTRAYVDKFMATVEPERGTASPGPNATLSTTTYAAPSGYVSSSAPSHAPLGPERTPSIPEDAPTKSALTPRAEEGSRPTVSSEAFEEQHLAWPRLIAAATAATGFLAFLAWALYHRVERKNCLDNANRRRIFEEIQKDPGVRIGTLQARTGLSYKTVADHVAILERLHFVQSSGEGHRRYFVNGGTFTPKEQSGIVAASAPAAKAILAHLGRAGETDLPTVAAALGVSVSTASRAASRLEAAGLLLKRRVNRRILLRLSGQPAKT